MSLVDIVVSAVEGRGIKEPIFLKEYSSLNSQLRELTELGAKLKPSLKRKIIEGDIDYLKQCIEGENNVAFELNNSFLPILCLQDIRLEYEDYVAQFDFIVISNKFICTLETLKLNGDIEITSLISQNERHLNILKEILIKEKLIVSLPVKSLVVMANPQTILDMSKFSESIQNSIYKYDQVITFLKGLQEDKSNDKNNLEMYMYRISDYLIKNNKPLQMDYYVKYGLIDDDFL